MITNAVVGFLFKFMAFIVNFLPAFDLPASALGAFLEAASWVAVINHYIPFSTFLSCIAVYFVIWLSSAIFSAILKVL